MAGISSLGIGSGVLTSDLVDQLVQAEKAPAESRLTRDTERTQALISAYGKLRSAVTELRLPMRQLSNADSMRAFSATSSNEAIGVTVDSKKAGRGSYSIEVTSLAASQALASRDVFSDRDATSVGQGTLSLTVAGKTPSVVIDSTNDPLQGLANAINEAEAGVSAGVVDTGSGFQLVLSADESGTANAVSISVTGDNSGTDTDNLGLSRFAFNDSMDAEAGFMETIAAKDAVMKVNGIEVTRSTNSFENVIDGLSFDVSEVGSATVRVAQDFGSVADRVGGFVEKFNALQGTIQSLSGFSPEAGGSILTGDSAIRGLQNQLRQMLTSVVPGLEKASVRTLADVGITTDFETGNLQFDREVFEEKLKAYPNDVTALFAEEGRTTDNQVEFVTSSANTDPGTYAINVTQAATRGTLTAGGTVSAPVTIDDTNDEMTFLLNGDTSVSISLSQNTYNTAEEFAAEIRSQLAANSVMRSSGSSIAVEVDGSGALKFTSGTYGSESSVSITSVEDGTGFGVSVATGAAGTDVAGTIGGRTAKGDGQILFLESDSRGGPSGLQVRILGDATGDRGTIQFVEGIGERTVDFITDWVGKGGALEARTSSLNTQLERIAQDQVRLEERIEAYRERLVRQFQAADSLISRLNSTQEYVSQQLAALAPQNNRDN